MSGGSRQTEYISVSAIENGNRARSVKDDAVQRLMESMAKIGMKSPITVRYFADRHSETTGTDDSVVLVAGAHRLEAAKRLGWDKIECFVVNDGEEGADEDRARMWEIAENLHRAELTALERDEHISEWLRLANKPPHLGEVSGGRGNKGGIEQARRELGLSKGAVDRATKVAGLTEEAKEAAKEVGLDNNQSALLKVAAQSIERQADAVREIAERRASKIDADVKDRAANECAQIIAEYVPGEAWDALKANLYAAGANNIANALTNITGQSIMDRRFA